MCCNEPLSNRRVTAFAHRITSPRIALKAIRATDEIVIIGFSLPPTDYRPRVLLQLAGLDRTPPPRIILVDPHAEDVVERYEKYVRTDIEKKQVTWTEWFAEITD